MKSIPLTTSNESHATVRGGWGVVAGRANDFAVGFSCQPLPNGQRFARRTLTSVSGITATDAITRWEPVFVILRPETGRFPEAKNIPTATLSADAVSIAAGTGVGRNKNANGVKQQLSGIRSRGGGFHQRTCRGDA
jgi:hypothetical protein